ncbi:MAG: ATP-binding protein [Pseudomonadota bacterium]
MTATNTDAPLLDRTFGLYVKLSAVLVPTFLLFASVGLFWLSDRILQAGQEQMALRIGGSTARVGGALERFSDRAYDMDEEVDWGHDHVQDLMQTLLSDPAVRCMQLREEETGQMLLTLPQGLGCEGMQIDETLEFEVFSEPLSLLTVNYHTNELREAKRNQREFSIALLVGGLVIAMAANWLSFSLIIGRPLNSLVDRLRRARDEAQAANHAKSSFLANVSHEIRTPMNGIIGMADMLGRTKLSKDQKTFVQTIAGSGEALLTIINDILDFSKAEAGKVEIKKEVFSPAAVFEQVGHLLGPLADKKGLEITLDIASDIPDFVSGDAGRLRQSLLNVAGNAVKFTFEGGVTLRARRHGQGQVEFEIQDTGIGIPSSKLATIFSAFEQVDNELTRNFEGTGLGLAISKQLIGLMGGQIVVASKEGLGTVFTITLPFEIAEAPVGSVESEPTSQSAANSTNFSNLGPILVVDDNATNSLVVKHFVKDTGLTCHFAENGKEAVEAYEKSPYRLILMDVSMPVMNGYQATGEIRNIEKIKGLERSTIIAVTANASEKDNDTCLRKGMDNCLTKPLRKQLLVEEIRKHIGTPVEEAP